MKKKGLFMMAAACLLAATSCSEDEVVGDNVLSNNEIGLLTRVDSRAVETKITNLGKFTVNAFQAGEANYMNNVEYTTSDNGSSWTTAAGKFFWPVEGDLHLYGYAPAAPGKGGTFKIDKDAQTLTDFVPFETADAQQDFVYAKSTGNNATNGTTGVELNFQHALTEISVAAKNSNTAYTVKVTGVKLGNVKTKGTFTFPSIANSAASWTLSDASADVGSYETTWSNASVLTSSVSPLDEANVPFMLLPQQLEKSDKASEKAYLALKVNITMQGGKVIHDGWAYIGLNTNWEMGKHYTYTVDFSDGAGQDETGKLIISGKEMVLNVKVTPWNEKAIAYPSSITGTATGELTYKVGGQNGASYKVTPDASGNWSIPVAKFDGVTDMSSMFSRCSKLTTLDLSGWNTSSVINMTYMFWNCSKLITLDLSGWNTSSVTDMSSMFSSCSSLTSLDLSGWNVSNVTTMQNMFGSCTSLTSLDVSGWNTSSVTDMRSMFSSCSKLTTLDLSHFNTEKVTTTSNMFWNCSKLTTLDLSGWNTSNATNMSSMFYNCSSLTSLDVSHFNTEKVTTTYNMFSGCSSLTSLDVSHFNTEKVTNMSSMFFDCGSLTSLDVSHFNTEKVTRMDNMFSYCKLTSLDLSHFNTSSVTGMSSMFSSCSKLTTLDLSGWNTSLVTNMERMFKGCTSLKRIRMVDCSSATVDKIKAQLATDGITSCTIVTE